MRARRACALLNEVFDAFSAHAQRPLVPVLVQKWMLLILAFLRISGCVTERERERGDRGRREDKKRG